MKKLIFFVTLLLLTFLTHTGFARELLVLSGEKSQSSKRWQEEVLPEYETSTLGKSLPVKIVPVQGKLFPEWMAKALDEGRVDEIFGTPTFIIWDPKKEKEIGRIEGYTQKPKFFSQLNEAMSLIEKGQHPGKREGSGHREEGSGGETRQEEGSGNSSNIMDHIYKTPEEAKKASKMLGLGGETHSHETAEGTIYMPGSTM
ncbi:hypothetical protein OAT11_05035 [Nitrospinaceae bacterium]|nr:hypothetical protein [Nitrospinaceae bacterium]